MNVRRRRMSAAERRFTRRAALLAAAFTVTVAVAAGAGASAAERTETLKREIALASGVREVVIDNVLGPVHVTTGSDRVVVLEVRQHATAHHESELDEAFREVTLKVETQDDRLELTQDGPFRCHEDGRWSRSDCDWDPDYEMTWEWNVIVPPGVDLEVSTVNGGLLSVDGASGSLRAINVNGALRLTGLTATEVEALTVNGGVEADFERAPSGASTFKTVNGKVELTLPSTVAAEVAVETLHGDLYTDFEIESVPVKAVAERESGNTHRYRYTQDMVVRIGGGGSKPRVRLDCTTVNGDVVVRAR